MKHRIGVQNLSVQFNRPQSACSVPGVDLGSLEFQMEKDLVPALIKHTAW